MSYSVIGTGTVGSTLASFFANAGIEVALASTKGADAVEPLARKIGRSVGQTRSTTPSRPTPSSSPSNFSSSGVSRRRCLTGQAK
jgi:3-hydroxyacyl-CoA dehydrogenase